MEKMGGSSLERTGLSISQRGEKLVKRQTKGNQQSRTNTSTLPSTVTPQTVDKSENAMERSKYVFDLTNKWIENADNKVSVSCGIFVGVFTVITFLAEHYIKASDNPVINECCRLIYKGSFVLSILFMSIAVCFFACAIIPNLKSSGKRDKKKYPIFYGDIEALSFEDYKKLMEKGTDKDFIDELILENWHNSSICTRKMKHYKDGVIFSLVAVCLAFISIAAHFLMFR